MTQCAQNHGGTTAEQVLSLRRDVGSEFLKLTLDTGNFPPASRFTPDKLDHIAACAPYTAIVHAKFFNVGPDGRDRDFDYGKIREVLARAGFRGFLSVEYEGKDPDETAVLRRVAPYLNTLR